VSDPAVVLLDEPFAALDAITRLRMHDLVRALHHQYYATMLLVTRDVDGAIAWQTASWSCAAAGSAVTTGWNSAAWTAPTVSRARSLRANLLPEIGVSSSE